MRLTDLDFPIIEIGSDFEPSLSVGSNYILSARNPITVTLPLGQNGDRLNFFDTYGIWDVNPITLTPKPGTLLFGTTSPAIFNGKNQTISLICINGNWITVALGLNNFPVQSVNTKTGHILLTDQNITPIIYCNQSQSVATNKTYLVDTNLAEISLTLPVAPLEYDFINFVDYSGSDIYIGTGWGKNKLTILKGNNAHILPSNSTTLVFDQDLTQISLLFHNGRWVYSQTSYSPRIVKQKFRTISFNYTLAPTDLGQWLYVNTLCTITLPSLESGWQAVLQKTSTGDVQFLASAGTLYGKGNYIRAQWGCVHALSLGNGDWILSGETDL